MEINEYGILFGGLLVPGWGVEEEVEKAGTGANGRGNADGERWAEGKWRREIEVGIATYCLEEPEDVGLDVEGETRHIIQGWVDDDNDLFGMAGEMVSEPLLRDSRIAILT